MLKDSVPLFAGVEDLDDLLIMTMDEKENELQDEITIYHPVYQYLKKNNLIEFRDSIGTSVPVKIRDKLNKTTGWITGFDDSKNIPANVSSEANFAYGHLAGVQMYNREQLVKNAGPEQLVDFIDELEDQLMTTLLNDFGDAIVGSQDADGRKIMGLGRIMQKDAVCGGIDPTAQGKSYWNPTVALKPDGVTKFNLATEYLAGVRKAVRSGTVASGVGSSPDVCICGEDVYDQAQAYYMDKLQVSLDDLKGDKWDDLEMFSINKRTFIYEPSMSAKLSWFMNFKNDVKLRIHSGTHFKYDSWQMMSGKVQTKKRNNLTYAALYCKKRRSNVVLEFQ